VLSSGTYRFNLLGDGNECVAPGGVAIVAGSLGGIVGELVVP
jgi:hypothetical protein